MKTVARCGEIAILLQMLDEAYYSKSWHGSNLRGSLRNVAPKEAEWRPARNRHNIWEIAVHAAYWKYVVRRRILGEKRGSFPLKGSNWFARPQVSRARAWREDLVLLDEMHASLRGAVSTLSARDLHATPPGVKASALVLVAGIIHHDVYHAGQIQLLKRLQR